MKACKNKSGDDVSFTSRISQSLTNSSQAFKPAPASSSGLCRSSHSKISQNSLELGGLVRAHALSALMDRLAHISEFRLSAHLSHLVDELKRCT